MINQFKPSKEFKELYEKRIAEKKVQKSPKSKLDSDLRKRFFKLLKKEGISARDYYRAFSERNRIKLFGLTLTHEQFDSLHLKLQLIFSSFIEIKRIKACNYRSADSIAVYFKIKNKKEK